MKERISRIVDESEKLNEAIESIQTFGLDYNLMTEEQQYTLGSYVNLMLSSTQLLINPIKGCVKCTKIMLWAFLPSVRNTVHVTHSFSGRIWRTSGILCMLCGLFAESTAAFVLYIVSIIAAIIISILHSYLFYKKKV